MSVLPAVPKTDLLKAMLDKQATFQKRLYGAEFLDWDAKQRVEYIKEHSIHLTQELHEMLYELPYFKPWKNYDAMDEEAVCTAFAKARGEFVDMWHFMMNIMIQLGFTVEQLSFMYNEKHKENNQRQDDGYDHTKSYRKEEK